MSEVYSIEWFVEKRDTFEDAYFGDSKKKLIQNLGITVSNQITKLL